MDRLSLTRQQARRGNAVIGGFRQQPTFGQGEGLPRSGTMGSMTALFAAPSVSDAPGSLTAREQRRSIWHGLTGSEALELADAETTPRRLRMSETARARDIATEYAIRTVRALTSNDLRAALRAAAIAEAALVMGEQLLERSAQRESERQAVVHEDPATSGRQRPRALPRQRADAGVIASSS